MKLIALLSLFLVGCATGYQKNSFSGGYVDTQLAKDIFKVEFSGNGYTSSSKVKEYALRRSAELTIEQGYNHFVILDGNNSSSVYSSGTRSNGNISSNYYGGYNYSGNSQTNFVTKSDSELIIKLFKEGNQPPMALDASLILKKYEEPSH